MLAVALRIRWRRQQVPDDLRDEIAPKNIIMIGPTGVGKTEIARRLAKLAQAPFLKVEASKFTEVGYVGRDVDSMIRDLAELSVQLVKGEEQERVKERARELAEERLLDLLTESPKQKSPGLALPNWLTGQAPQPQEPTPENEKSRERLRLLFRQGQLDDRYVEVETQDTSIPM